MGWWGIDLASTGYQETPEFPLVISDHGPGIGTPTGAVVDAIGQYMPVTFNALRYDSDFGDRYMQKFADRAKRETMGQIVTADEEVAYDPQLIDYLGKLAAKHLCTPAKDYWMRQWKTRTTQSPVEISSYPDQIAALDQLHARLCHELPDDLRQLRYYLGDALPVAKAMAVPMSSLEHVRQRTPNPALTPEPRLGGPHWDGLLFP
jgi:ribosomal protein S16